MEALPMRRGQCLLYYCWTVHVISYWLFILSVYLDPDSDLPRERYRYLQSIWGMQTLPRTKNSANSAGSSRQTDREMQQAKHSTLPHRYSPRRTTTTSNKNNNDVFCCMLMPSASTLRLIQLFVFYLQMYLITTLLPGPPDESLISKVLPKELILRYAGILLLYLMVIFFHIHDR